MRKKISYILLLLLILVIILKIYLHNTIKSEIIKQFQYNQNVLGKLISNNINFTFSQIITYLESISKDEHIITFDDTGIKIMNDVKNKHPELITAISRINSDGQIMYTIPYDKNAMGKNISCPSLMAEIKKTQKTTISGQFKNMWGFNTTTITKPLFNAAGNYQGAVSILLSLEYFNNNFSKLLKFKDSHFYHLLIVNDKGDIIYSCKPNVANQNIYDLEKKYPNAKTFINKIMVRTENFVTIRAKDLQLKDIINLEETVNVKNDEYLATTIPDRVGENFLSIIVISLKRNVLSLMSGSITQEYLLTYFIIATIIVFFTLFVMSEKLESRLAERASMMGKLEKFNKALSESEKKYSALVENAHDCICLVKDNNFLFVNKSMTEMTGYSDKELIGENFEKIVAVDQIKTMRNIYWHRSHGDRSVPSTYETKIVSRNKEIIDVILDVKLIKYNNEDVELIFLRDISEQKALQAQLLQAQKMESIGTLAGGIAHDFNNLLTGIIGYSSLLINQTEKASPLHEPLSEIHKAALTAAELTEQLLTFSRKTITRLKPLNINSVVRDVYLLVCRAIGHTIEVKLFLDENVKNIEANENRIIQVIMNTCINSRDAMPEGGTVLIETNNVTLTREYCRSHYWAKPGEFVCLSISDTGYGIEQYLLERIFDPFFTTKEQTRGTGLGLAMVYGIIKNHNGLINVYSEKGVGTTFKFYFPITEKPIEQSEKKTEQLPTHSAKSPTRRETILIVDDEEIVRNLVKTILDEQGYKTLTAANGEEALVIYKNNVPTINLVLLDLTMPKMNGTTTFTELKKIDKEVKVLLSSGYTIDGEAKMLINKGAIAFIQKPYSVKEILKKIREILDGSV